VDGDLLRMPTLRIGALEVSRPSTALAHDSTGPFGATAPTDGTVGEPVFRRMHVTFDYSRSRLILEPRARLDVPDTLDASGLTLTGADSAAHAWRIAEVIPGSAGANAGVQAGDELVAVDGQPAAALSRDQIRELLRSDGVTRHLAIRRGPITSEVSVHLKMIF
jgi:membrane-associated protease RseP (regulator of RpoE activity)